MLNSRSEVLINACTYANRYVINCLLEEKKDLMLKLKIASSKRYEAMDNEDNAKLNTLMEVKLRLKNRLFQQRIRTVIQIRSSDNYTLNYIT